MNLHLALQPEPRKNEQKSFHISVKTLNISNFRKKIKPLLFNVLGNEDNYLNVNYLIEYFVKLT